MKSNPVVQGKKAFCVPSFLGIFLDLISVYFISLIGKLVSTMISTLDKEHPAQCRGAVLKRHL